jgi:radical SAM protein with 4Fe4S-binding SPASM domain
MGSSIKFMKAGLGVLLRPEKAWNSPVHLQIEPTTVCNLKCSFCVREKNVFRPKSLSLEQFRSVFDQVQPVRVTFAGDGEPTLAPDIWDMVAHARERGAKTIITSNWTIGPRLAARALDSGLSALRVSIDAATPATYVKMRKADYHAVIVEGIRRLQELKRERGSSTPDVGFEYVLGRDNLHEMREVIDLARSLGICRVNFRPLNLVGIEEREGELLGGMTKDQYREALHAARDHARELDIPTNLDEVIGLLPFYEVRYTPEFNPEGRSPDCIYPWVQVYVAVDGNVTPCCALQMDEKVTLGNMFEEGGFAAVWNGQAYRTMRRDIVKRRVSFKSCVTCEGRGVGKVASLALRTPGFLKKPADSAGPGG